MLNPQTLRGRLTLTYASALVLALIAFALLAIAVLDRAQRSALDAQLATTARAGLALDVSEGPTSMDETDRAQFATIVGAKASGAIFRSDGSVIVSSTYAVPPQIRAEALREPHAHYATLRIAGERLRLFAAPVVSAGARVGAMAVWRDAETIEALDRSVALAFALAIPLLAAIAIAFGAAIARRGLAPLDHIATVASEIEGRDLSRRLALPPRSDELGRLAATFDRMLDRLQRAFIRERRFTSDASHELRAPLSVIRAEADLALRKERAPHEYRRALEAIAAEADALEALTRDLLAAARADAPRAASPVPVDLGAIASRAADRLGVLAESRGIRVVRRLQAETVGCDDPDTLERAVVTVLHNAVKYAPDGGTVELHVARDGDAVELCIADDGPGFSPDALTRAFDRFWRDDEARSREGSGLGLAIAKAIVESSGGSIAIANAHDGGAVVRLRFAAQPPEGASSS